MFLAVAAFFLLPALGQTIGRSYGLDPGHNKYSTLKQITKSNVSQLKVAWTYRTGERAPIYGGGEAPAATRGGGTPAATRGGAAPGHLGVASGRSRPLSPVE